jgi:hypothetical protein
MSAILPYATIRQALDQQSLFEDKTWRLSPSAWPLTADQVEELRAIGQACVEFHQALETLYLRSADGRNLLRNRPLLAPWVADYLDRGKPPELVALARSERLRGSMPTVLRPDLLLTDDGFAMSELDSVPGGIGLTAFLNRLYARSGDQNVLGGADEMIEAFYASLAALRPELSSPCVAIVVSEEAGTYRPEMEWLAEQLQRLGRRVFCIGPGDLFPLENSLFLDSGGSPEKVDIVYRFFELFDLDNVPSASFLIEAWEQGEVVIAPPMRPFQEEKLGLALFHHQRLQDYWAEALSKFARKLLGRIIPKSWVLDPAPLPPGAVLDGPLSGGRPIADWRDLGQASQKERELILKISGFHETAWGARSVLLGSDSSREEWQAGLDAAIAGAGQSLHVLQEYRKPRRLSHPLYGPDGEIKESQGRLRLCPYYFVQDGQAELTGALATFCPPDKKIIHGMVDAALLPCRVTG